MVCLIFSPRETFSVNKHKSAQSESLRSFSRSSPLLKHLSTEPHYPKVHFTDRCNISLDLTYIRFKIQWLSNYTLIAIPVNGQNLPCPSYKPRFCSHSKLRLNIGSVSRPESYIMDLSNMSSTLQRPKIMMIYFAGHVRSNRPKRNV